MKRLGRVIQQACGAGGSIKPRVERRGTLCKAFEFREARGTGGSGWVWLNAQRTVSRACLLIEIDPRVALAKPRFTLGFMLSPAPQAS
jgi:hypothetical protein